MGKYNYLTSREIADLELNYSVFRILSNLTSWFAKLLEAHHRRTVSLRVFDASRLDGSACAGQSHPETNRAVALRQGDNFPRNLKNWLMGCYRAYEARVIALRVYDRSRIDRVGR